LLITGAHGLLGQKSAIVAGQETDATILLTDLQRTTVFKNPRFDYHQLDIANRNDVKSLVASFRPDVIINTAAMTDVDACETDRQAAWNINCDGVKNLIAAARRIPSCRIVQVSTDYVFNGQSAPYDETSIPDPVNNYGRSKLAAENALIMDDLPSVIVRTQLLYGTGYEVRRNFVFWVLSMLKKKKPFTVVDDQTGNPTMADDMAFALILLATRQASGVYHVAGPQVMSRYEWARCVAEAFSMDRDLIQPASSADLGQAARRPMNSGFITLKYEAGFGHRLATVQDGLKRLDLQLRHGAQHLDLLPPRSPDADFTAMDDE
jgi:dTDP-4-dehydrorhamnose reductase